MTEKTTHAEVVRRLIRLHGATLAGFHHGMSAAAGIPQPTSSRVCRLMLKSGALFQAEAPGRRIHLHVTAELSQAWKAKALAEPVRAPVRRGFSQRIKADADRQTVLTLAATPKGFAPYAHDDGATTKLTWLRHTHELKAKGLLFGVRINGFSRFFSALEAADAARAHEVFARAERAKAQAAHKRERQQGLDALRRQSGRTHHAKAVPKVVKPKVAKPKALKAAKPPKVIKRKEIFVKQMARPASAPRVDAVIIWPARMPECRMMPPPRNQVITHSFIHGGMGVMR